MQILYSPQRSDKTISYIITNEVITCEQNGQTDTFDFTTLPNGMVTKIETTLGVNPILSAKRENGELFVELLYFHGEEATESELYPVWQEVGING